MLMMKLLCVKWQPIAFTPHFRYILLMLFCEPDANSGRKTMIKLVVAGECQVGKTELVRRFTGDDFQQNYIPTIMPKYSVKEIKAISKKVLLQIWDISGREEFFGHLGSNFYRDTDCCVLVYDVTNPTSFEMLDKWLNEFLIQVNPWSIAKFPIAVIGNKTDLKESRLVSRAQAEQWCRSRTASVIYLEASAKSKSDVKKTFQSIARHVLATEKLTQQLQSKSSSSSSTHQQRQHLPSESYPETVTKKIRPHFLGCCFNRR